MDFHTINSLNVEKEVFRNMEEELSPYEYYRRLRPEYFSDTRVVYKATLKEEQFQYIMDRLSNDMKQDLFENLTKSLVLRFITPNIIPQTGPTGGGDGKTDLETHPVADDISDRWYIGDGGCRGSEKWAFAISCKEDWKVKVKEDVKNIVKTGRGFTKVFFFSNRLIKSKDSKECEDALTQKYKIPVQIIGQNWYVDKVFRQGCLDIAVKELNLSSEYCENITEIGPRDKIRKERLDEVEDEILTRQSETLLDTELVDLALEAAVISRSLELSPSTTRGRFKRAKNLANRYGTKQQIYKVIYQTGWTEYYWFENPDATYDCYVELKMMLNDEINVVRIEKILTLYTLLETAAHLNLFKTDIDIESESKYIDSMHNYLKTDGKHRASYLYMHIQWLEMKMLRNYDDNDMIDDIIEDLSKSLKEAEHYIDIPLECNEDELELIGHKIKENERFEGLIDEFADILSKRQLEIKAAEIQYRRGEQNLEAGNHVQAIRHLGQCVSMFGKEQTMSEYVRACGLLGMAYIEQDLIYAGKAMLMRTASLLLHQVETQGAADHLLITVLNEICKMELSSGQIIDYFNYYHLREVFSNLNPDFQDDSLLHAIAEEQNCLSIRLIACDVSKPVYGKLPDILRRLGMVLPLDFLFYKLGYHDKESDEFRQIVNDDPLFLTEVRKKINEDFFLFENSIAEDASNIETLVNGCRITASSKSNEVVHTCAEAILAYIESLCSTMGFKDFSFATSHIHFDVVEVDVGKTEIVIGQDSSHYIFNVNTKDVDDQKLWEALCMFPGFLFSQNAMTKDLLRLFEDKQNNERLMNRLSVLMTYLSDFKNVTICQYKPNVKAWQEDNDMEYLNQGADDISVPFEERKGKQASCTISSIIDYPLWDKAKWKGCGFYMDLQLMEIPILLFCYKDIKAGIKIFEGWAELYKQNKLNIRITIVMHVSKKHPAWYRVQVGQDIMTLLNEGKWNDKVRHVMQSARIHTMQPNTTENIDRFRFFYESKKSCGISAVAMNENNEMAINDKDKRYGMIIPVKNVVFREAWEIGVGDMDSPAILPDDDPIIPVEHLNDAPVLELLKKERD